MSGAGWRFLETFRFQRAVRSLWEGMLDLVYPPVCRICERWDRPPLCDDCHAAFVPIPEPVCALCGRPETPNLDCHNCADAAALGGWGFDGARAAGVYFGPLREGIHQLKYRGAEELGPLLGAYLADRCIVEALLPTEWRANLSGVIPVPLHPRRERKRGYNQATLLAAPVADALHIPLLTNAVQRARQVAPQVGLTGEQRRRNLTPDLFTIPDPSVLSGKRFLLVDDVFTTGSTVSACAGALKAAGAPAVYVVTLAAGE